MTRLSLALAIHVLAATAARADSDLSMQDLQALDKQKQWTELLDAADRVKPSARTADWRGSSWRRPPTSPSRSSAPVRRACARPGG